MNTMLPSPRDLPPRRHAEIRADLLRAATGERRRARYAPIITGVAALGALAVVAAVLLVPSKPNASPATGDLPTATKHESAANTTESPHGTPLITPVHAPGPRPDPVLPGVSPEQRTAIETGCGHSASQSGPVRLYNLVTDAAGQFGLLYGETAALDCTIGQPSMPYNSGFAGAPTLDWLAGPVNVDIRSASAGGDGGKPEYRGQLGVEVFAGRVSPEVAKVTVTKGGKTTQGVVANRTFVVRILHPASWQIPNSPSLSGTVQAYDAAGHLLSSKNLDGTGGDCYATPDGTPVAWSGRQPPADPKACKTATPWH